MPGDARRILETLEKQILKKQILFWKKKFECLKKWNLFSLCYPRGTKGSLKKNSANLEQPFGYIYKYIYMSEELYL